jgi:hypothetical protein
LGLDFGQPFKSGKRSEEYPDFCHGFEILRFRIRSAATTEQAETVKASLLTGARHHHISSKREFY